MSYLLPAATRLNRAYTSFAPPAPDTLLPAVSELLHENQGGPTLECAVLSHIPFHPFMACSSAEIPLGRVHLHNVCLFSWNSSTIIFSVFSTLSSALLSLSSEWIWVFINKFCPLTALYLHMIHASYRPPNFSAFSLIPPSHVLPYKFTFLVHYFLVCLVSHRVCIEPSSEQGVVTIY